ncbi:MAG: BT_3928 family protein, partial [Prevotella pectinovora]
MTKRLMNKETIKDIGVNVCRFVVALTFVFSGYVKAVDPIGTQYKLNDYLAAENLEGTVPDYLTLSATVLQAAEELSLGILLLFAIRRRLVSKLILAFMTVMTAITVWIAIADPVKDCGCFGDALKLTNGETLLKNIVLLAASIVVCKWPCAMVRFIGKANQWIAINYTILYSIATSTYCLYALPVFDFRPYHIGADIRKGMEIPPGAEQPQFETTFILKKNGQTKEFSLENYPDSTWTFVDSKTVQTSEGYVPPIHDFSMEDMTTGD